MFIEGAYTLQYAWNSAPVTGTDISRSLLVCGREFHFPLDFVNNTNMSYMVDDQTIKSYSGNMTDLMAKCREVYELLIQEHRALHREYRNS